jgi:transposase
MFNLNDSMRYYLYPFPADMRKSFYTLSGIVTDLMRQDVRSGDVFIFINRSLTSMKLLHMEHGGLVIYHLKLEAGSFKLPVLDEQSHTHPTNWRDLMLMVQGIDIEKCQKRKRFESSINTG